LIPVKERKFLIDNTRVELKNFNFIPIVLTSALKNKGIMEVINKAVDVFEQGSKMIDDKLIEKMVLPRLVSNPPSNRVRYMQLKQSGYLPPKFDLITNVAKDVSDTYQRFVINEIRNYFGFSGNPIRLTVKSY